MIPWCYVVAQLGDVATKRSDTARAPLETVRPSRISVEVDTRSQVRIHTKPSKRGFDILAEPYDKEFADDIPRDPKSVKLIT